MKLVWSFVVHQRLDTPLVDTLGLAVPPGFRTYAAMRQTNHKNLPKPHGTCQLVDIGEDHYYNKKECLIDCRLEFIIEKCGCRPLGYYGDIRLCSPLESSACVKDAIQEYRSSDSPSMCDCPTPCTDITYTTSLSMTIFPSDKVLEEYKEKLQKDKQVTNDIITTIPHPLT